jgi:hypothetical protein
MCTTALGSKPVSWSLVGFGAGGRVFHAPLIRSASGMSLDVVVASEKHRGQPSL